MVFLYGFWGFFHWSQNLQGFLCSLPSWYVISQSPPARRPGSTVHQCHSQNPQQGPKQGIKQLLRILFQTCKHRGREQTAWREQWSPNQLTVRDSQIQHPDVSLVQEHLHRGAWAPAQSWVLSSKNLTSSFRRAAAPGKNDYNKSRTPWEMSFTWFSPVIILLGAIVQKHRWEGEVREKFKTGSFLTVLKCLLKCFTLIKCSQQW